MKKFFALLSCVIICISLLASCADTGSKAVPLTDVYSSLTQVTNMPAMEVMPDELVETLFGFDLAKFEEYIFAEAADPSVNADTVILIKLADKADTTAVCDVLDGYLQSVKDNTQSYSPVNYAKTQSSAVSLIGDYIYLIVTSEYSEAEQVVINALEKGVNDSTVQTLINE